MLDHDDHDGIEEHDNHLPNWWLATLFGGIVFAIGYWVYYQELHVGPSSREALAAEQLALAKLHPTGPQISEAALLARGADAQAVARGHEIFVTNCIVCHGEHAEGKIGPNLTDSFWLHGGRPLQILGTVANGVPDKGMLSWQPIVGDEKVEDVVSFVLSLKNTNVAGKAPQGNKEP